MSSAHTLETMIKKTHAKYTARVALHEAIGTRTSERIMQMAFNKLDKLIKAYQDPATPKKVCVRCRKEHFATYDYVKRNGKRSEVCKPCELTSYSNLYAKNHRMFNTVPKPIAVNTKMSTMTKHILAKGATQDYNLMTSQLRWRIKNLNSKLDGYTSMEMAGGYVRPQDRRSVVNTVSKLSDKANALKVMYKEQMADIKAGIQPKDLATLWSDWQLAHGG